MVIVSVNPGTASPSGTPNPTTAGVVVVVVGDGRVVEEEAAVSSVDVVLVMTVASRCSGSLGDGDLSSQPYAKAATATATIAMNRSGRPGPSPGGGGENCGSIIT
jgi:hypothetical protein